MGRKRKHRGNLPGAKDKKPRFRRTPAEIAIGLTIEQAIKVRDEKEKIRRRTEAKIGRIKVVKNKWVSKKNSETCGVRIVAVIVKVNGNSRLKIQKNDVPELAPCEELVCKITYEKDGVSVHSIFSEVRSFAEALAKCAGEDLLHL
ncbi:MAG: hypothetical protein COU82_02095 [Candidatus Portnoybacteria bacterium CG10_big_fil_rev_8_21_14_0_10_38_18]|uniref:Uncharacterized protein n=1 Tax=Candidatus Portnoybacteria bacterium CG10_big_fil_rev_8_21_14_0_10_38_18 TaxID=1974813 RepID=A0A2M8KBX4_9BACT|nr:MAG: hypothetical protein COU82_02095 [Candidatus Portnoybacteria bacterium CG10_big_fil_rev_8_21_14_0_10_38_18]